MIIAPRSRKKLNDFPHGACGLREATTITAEQMSSANRSGFVVWDAPAARESDHNHQAHGCNQRAIMICSDAKNRIQQPRVTQKLKPFPAEPVTIAPLVLLDYLR